MFQSKDLLHGVYTEFVFGSGQKWKPYMLWKCCDGAMKRALKLREGGKSEIRNEHAH